MSTTTIRVDLDVYEAIVKLVADQNRIQKRPVSMNDALKEYLREKGYLDQSEDRH